MIIPEECGEERVAGVEERKGMDKSTETARRIYFVGYVTSPLASGYERQIVKDHYGKIRD
jgi:hypothetical protein